MDIRLVLLCLSVFVVTVYCEHFTNKFAVHIPGGEHRAREVASKHGYVHFGQIGTLEDHYLFEHPHVHRRSVEHNRDHHEHLTNHPHVAWFEQQVVKSRKKRDYIPMSSHVNSGEKMVSKRETVSKQDLKFNDQLWDKMWYFHGGGLNHTDMNVMGAWKRGVTGKNVVITILDDGIERTHDDLKDNYDPYASYDVNGHDSDPMPRYDYTNENRHGTRCAGEVSAKANNTKCIVGVAYDSKIGGVRMLDGDVYDAVEATSLSHNRSHIDIYSASWGPDDDGRVVDGPGVLAKKAFIDGVRLGRNGKGSIFVWASGNGGNQKDSCNCDGYTDSIYTLSISSISQHGREPWYLEECSSTLATTYSSGTYNEKQIITVDLHNKCTETHTGTSASAPLAAGIVALILEVKPSLTWRDVQYVTLMTSRPLPDGTWVTNGVGRQVSLRYGYGLMDATAMVELAEKWTNVPPQHICEVRSKTFKASPRPKIDIPASGKTDPLDTDACAGTTKAINYLEHVQVKITMKGKRRGDIVIHITSPMGTKSTILPKRPNDSDKVKGFDGWAFLSVHFWGENPVGVWTLQVDIASTPRSNIYSGSYSGGQTTNDLLDWSLIMYGTEENPVNLVNPTPHVTDTPEPTKSGNCHSQCLADCSGPGANQCGACKSYRIQATGTCVQSCPNNYYADEFNCKSCDQTCDTCTYISSNKVMCLKCKAGYLLVEGKGTCESFCEKGYYKETVQTTVGPLHERSDIDCLSDSISIFLPNDLLPASRNVTWREWSCYVPFNGSHYSDIIKLSDCGTTIQIDSDSVTFSNDIIVRTSTIASSGVETTPSTDGNEITFGDDYETVIPVQCVYPKHVNISTSYIPVKQNVRFFEKRYGKLDITMQQFDSEHFNTPIQMADYPRKVPLDDDVYIEISMNTPPGDARLKVDHCIATSKPSPADGNWHQLIQSGCPVNNVRLLSNVNDSDVKFTFKAFDFRHNATGFIYIHCEVSVCGGSDAGCTMGCPARARRAASDGNIGSHLVSTGPLLVEKEDETNKGLFSMPTVFAAVCLLVSMVAIVMAIIGWSRSPRLRTKNVSL